MNTNPSAKKRRSFQSSWLVYIIVAIIAVFFFLPMQATAICGGPLMNTDLYEFFAYLTCACFWWTWLADKLNSNAQ